MEKLYEQLYLQREPNHPWFVARRELFFKLLQGRERELILEVGCGSGIFLKYLSKRGFKNLEGVEPSKALRSSDSSIVFHKNLPNKKYDVVLSLDVLEHIEDDTAFL